MRHPRIARTAREVLLTTGAVLGVICIVFTILGFAFGLKPLIFQSGSMSPAIATGDLGFARSVPAADLRTGDVVSVINAAGERITHRLVDVAQQDDLRQLTLKGDANEAPDAEVYTVSKADRIIFHVPKAGYLVGWLSGPLGVFLLGAYAMFLLSVLVKRAPVDTPERRSAHGTPDLARNDLHAGGAGLAALVVVGMLTGGVAMHSTTPTAAAFQDDVAISGSTFTAYTVPATTVACGATGNRSVTFNWTAVAGATNYTYYYGTSGTTTATTTGTTATVTSGTNANGTFRVVVNRSFGSVTWSSAFSNTRTYQLRASSTCA